MEIVLGTLEFGNPSGGATYLLTVAEQLQRLGHEATIFAGEVGELAGSAQERGLRVVSSESALPDACDVVYAQDTATAYLLADRFRGTPQALCMHAGGSGFDRWLPPQISGVVGAVVVLHDVTARRAGALAHREEVVRLRQPVDLARFAPRAPIGESPGRVLLLGNYLWGDRRELVQRACRQAGLEYRQLGVQGARTTATPEVEINQADIVIGQGRCIVEAMACGRAAFVYDHSGGDGWVTPESHARMEAVNFTTADARVTPESLSGELRSYSPSMGVANRDLARLHHSAAQHAEELVGLFERLSPTEPAPNAPLRELARMVRVQWQTEARAMVLADEARAAEARAAEADAGHRATLARLEEIRATRRYRLASGLARPLASLRALMRGK